MREHKYRGKSISTGEWAYGNLIIRSDSTCAIVICENIECGLQVWHEVLPESVGQYTGLKDRNGKEIYEGDVISQRGQKNTYVEYYKGKWVIRNDEPKVEWRQELHNKTPLHIQIIGNTIDNPELIKP